MKGIAMLVTTMGCLFDTFLKCPQLLLHLEALHILHREAVVGISLEISVEFDRKRWGNRIQVRNDWNYALK